MNVKEFGGESVGQLFQNCWDALIEQYINYRAYGCISSEKDLQFVLAHNLLTKLQVDVPYWVHIEFPIPLNIKQYEDYLLFLGRVKRKKKEHIIPDIVVTSYSSFRHPIMIAEVKYIPEQINPLTEFGIRLTDRTGLKQYDDGIRSWQERYRIDAPYVDTYVLKNIDKYIDVLTDFKENKMQVQGYLCVVDEFCPNISEQIQKKIQKHNPPSNLKILATFMNLRDILTEVLKKDRRSELTS